MGQRTIAGVIAAVVVVVAVFILARPYLPISCTVGASGTALNVTVDGWGAGRARETMMNTLSTNVNSAEYAVVDAVIARDEANDLVAARR